MLDFSGRHGRARWWDQLHARSERRDPPQSPAAPVGSATTTTYLKMEGVIGTTGDTITGSAGNDVLRGGGGNDTLNGTARAPTSSISRTSAAGFSLISAPADLGTATANGTDTTPTWKVSSAETGRDDHRQRVRERVARWRRQRHPDWRRRRTSSIGGAGADTLSGGGAGSSDTFRYRDGDASAVGTRSPTSAGRRSAPAATYWISADLCRRVRRYSTAGEVATLLDIRQNGVDDSSSSTDREHRPRLAPILWLPGLRGAAELGRHWSW